MNVPIRFTRSYQITVNDRVTKVSQREFERVQKLSLRQLEAHERLIRYIAHLQRRKMRRVKDAPHAAARADAGGEATMPQEPRCSPRRDA